MLLRVLGAIEQNRSEQNKKETCNKKLRPQTTADDVLLHHSLCCAFTLPHLLSHCTYITPTHRDE